MKHGKWLLIFQLSLVFQPAHGQYHWTTPQPIDSLVLSFVWSQLATDDSGNIYVLGSSGNGLPVEHSTDGGTTWTHSFITSPDQYREPYGIVVDHRGWVWVQWMSFYTEFSLPVMHLSRSSDHGLTFQEMFYYPCYHYFSTLGVDRENSLYMLWVANGENVTRFRYGDIMQRIDAPILDDTLTIGDYAPLATSPDLRVYWLRDGGYAESTTLHEYVFLSVSDDTGKSFHLAVRVDTSELVGQFYVQATPAVAIDSSGTLFITYTRVLATYPTDQRDIRLVRSTDGGRSFTPPVVVSDTGAYLESKVCVDVLGGVNVLWKSETGLWHRRSTDGGRTFGAKAFVGPMFLHSAAADRKGFVYVVGHGYNGASIRFARTDITASVSKEREIPKGITLLPNYPNPFNPSTTIRFSLPHRTHVMLAIFNTLGQKVAELMNTEMPAGLHETSFNAGNLASGMYFYRLQAGPFVDTKSMLILK